MKWLVSRDCLPACSSLLFSSRRKPRQSPLDSCRKKTKASMRRATAASYKAPELYLGGIQLRIGKKVSTIDWNGGAGILGMDCLQHYCIQLDFAAGKLRFLDPEHLKTEDLGQAFPITISPW